MDEMIKLDKAYIMSYIQEDLVDRLTEEAYSWIFEDESDVQRMFTERLTQRIQKTILDDSELKEQLIENICDMFIESLDETFYREIAQSIIKDNLLQKVQKTITNPKIISKIIKESLS